MAVLPYKQHEWNVEKILAALSVLELEPAYAQSKRAMDTEAAARNKAAKVQSNAIAALEAQVQVFATQMSQHQNDKSSKDGDGSQRRQGKQRHQTPAKDRSDYRYKNKDFQANPELDQVEIDSFQKSTRASPTKVPGSDGQITYHVRVKRDDGKGFYFKTVSADFPGAIPDICWNFRNATSNADGSHKLPNKFHCGKCGHRPHLCPLKANTPAPTNVGAVSATQSDAGQLQTLQFDIKELLRTLGQSHIDTLQAVNASAGAGEADIDQLIADAQSKQSNLFMVNVHNEGRTNDAALSLNIDGVRAALDTCARHSVVTPDSWKRLHKAGKASAIVDSGPVYALQGCTKAPSTQVRERTVVTVGRGAQTKTVVALVAPIILPHGIDIVLSLHDLTAQGAVIDTVTQRVSLGGTKFPFGHGQGQPRPAPGVSQAGAQNPPDMLLVRHPVLPIETIVIAKASQETRPHALIIALDNEQLTMVDTGSLYTIIPFAAWKRMHDAGLASALVEKTDNVQFVSATGDDLGYTHCAVLYLQVAGESRPVNAKVVSKMDDSFPFLLGLQGLTTLGGVVHTPTSTVTFTARNGSAVGYSYEPVEEEAPLLPPVAAGAALAVKRA